MYKLVLNVLNVLNVLQCSYFSWSIKAFLIVIRDATAHLIASKITTNYNHKTILSRTLLTRKVIQYYSRIVLPCSPEIYTKKTNTVFFCQFFLFFFLIVGNIKTFFSNKGPPKKNSHLLRYNSNNSKWFYYPIGRVFQDLNKTK